MIRFLISTAVVFTSLESFCYYNPEGGRWINRDPIEEKGGVNVYGALQNCMVAVFDHLGLEIQYGHDAAQNPQRILIEKEISDLIRVGTQSATFTHIWNEMKDDKENLFVILRAEPEASNIFGGKLDAGKYFVQYRPGGSCSALAHESYHALQVRSVDRLLNSGNYTVAYNLAKHDPLGLGVSFQEFDEVPWYQYIDNGHERFARARTSFMLSEGPSVRVENRVEYEIWERDTARNLPYRTTYPIGNRTGIVLLPYGYGGKWNDVNRSFETGSKTTGTYLNGWMREGERQKYLLRSKP